MENDDLNRRKPQYREGRDACHRGLTVDACPYRSGVNRVSWLIGWYDERTWKKLGHIFRRHRMSWP